MYFREEILKVGKSRQKWTKEDRRQWKMEEDQQGKD
jgi:hypothetical protein